MNVETKDSWIRTEHGALFARCWTSPDPAIPDAPIVLLHDSIGCVELWRGFPATLAAATRRTVIAYDRLGFGRSDPHPGRLEIDFIGDEAHTFFPLVRAHFGFDAFVALGHSVGGIMATYCAARYGAACQALVTESAQTFAEDKTLDGIRAAKEQFRQPEHFQRLQRYHGDKTSWVLDAWINTWLSPEFSSWSLGDVLPQVRCPTLAIHGTEDEYGSTVHPERIVRSVAGPAELALMPGVRHVPHREQEPEVASLVARFLDKLAK